MNHSYEIPIKLSSVYRIFMKRGLTELKRLYPEYMELIVNEIKKDLYKTKAMAKLMYYDPANGDLTYKIEVLGKERIFPIHTVITRKIESGVETSYGRTTEVEQKIRLNDDLKGARFESEMKGSSLIRWIEQAIDNNEFH